MIVVPLEMVPFCFCFVCLASGRFKGAAQFEGNTAVNGEGGAIAMEGGDMT